MTVRLNDVTHSTVMRIFAIQWTMNLITREEVATSLCFAAIITGAWSVMSSVVVVMFGLFLMDMETMFILELFISNFFEKNLKIKIF